MKVPVTKCVQKSSRKTEILPVTILENQAVKKKSARDNLSRKTLKKLVISSENTFSTLKNVKITLFVIKKCSSYLYFDGY